jgi:hypothetical protein
MSDRKEGGRKGMDVREGRENPLKAMQILR